MEERSYFPPLLSSSRSLRYTSGVPKKRVTLIRSIMRSTDFTSVARPGKRTVEAPNQRGA